MQSCLPCRVLPLAILTLLPLLQPSGVSYVAQLSSRFASQVPSPDQRVSAWKPFPCAQIQTSPFPRAKLPPFPRITRTDSHLRGAKMQTDTIIRGL